MQLNASLLALFSALLLVQAAPAPFPTPAPEPVVDRLSIVASNRARFSAAASASAASEASVASVASASAAAASKASIVSRVCDRHDHAVGGANEHDHTRAEHDPPPARRRLDKWLYRIAQMRSAISSINAACATQTTKAYSDCTFGANRSSTQAASAATPAAVAPTPAA
ncbi:hypothetical protein JCM10449v2_007631 [Rhodotorula kratochvilovae]